MSHLVIPRNIKAKEYQSKELIVFKMCSICNNIVQNILKIKLS